MCKNVQKRASQIFLDPIQKRVPARSVQLESVYLEALLYFIQICDLLGTPYGPGMKIVSNDAISGWAEFGTLFQPGGTVCPPYFCLPIQI